MQYLRCLYVMFLVTGIALYFKAVLKRVDDLKDNSSPLTIFIIQIIWLLLGSLWIYLLLIFFGLKI